MSDISLEDELDIVLDRNANLKEQRKQLQAENAKLKAELEKHRWISVEERLPEETGYYQVLRYHNPYPTTREYYKEEGWISRDVVTHWKPIILPEN